MLHCSTSRYLETTLLPEPEKGFYVIWFAVEHNEDPSLPRALMLDPWLLPVILF